MNTSTEIPAGWMTLAAENNAEHEAALNTSPEIPAEWVALGREIVARTEAKRAEIAASDYRRRAVLRRGHLEVVLTLAPADSGTSWEVNGTGIEHTGPGRAYAGDTRSRYFTELDDAKAYANGWAANLTAKGYRLSR